MRAKIWLVAPNILHLKGNFISALIKRHLRTALKLACNAVDLVFIEEVSCLSTTGQNDSIISFANSNIVCDTYWVGRRRYVGRGTMTPSTHIN